MLRGVADTNVLVSAAVSVVGVCGQLLIAAEQGRWKPVVSPELMAELEDVLLRDKFEDRFSPDDVAIYLRRIGQVAELSPDAPQPWPTVTRDPDDDYLVALAKLAKVDFLISGDRHLTELQNLVPPVVEPAAFLIMVRLAR